MVFARLLDKEDNKLPIHWSSKVPKRYKRNIIFGDLLQTDFDAEATYIMEKFRKADYPLRFIILIIL